MPSPHYSAEAGAKASGGSVPAPGAIALAQIESVARELMARAAIGIPPDFKAGVAAMAEREPQPLSKFVLDQICCNYDAAEADQRPMCGDTGLPPWDVQMGNEGSREGGFVGHERTLRQRSEERVSRKAETELRCRLLL